MLKPEQYAKTVYRPYPPLFTSIILTGISDAEHYRAVIKEPFAIAGMIQADGVWYYLKSDMALAGKIGFKEWRQPSGLARAKRIFAHRERALLRAAASSDFKKFCHAYEAYMPALIIVWLTENLIERHVRRLLARKLPPAAVDELMHTLNIPEQNNYQREEELELAQTNNISRHVKKWEFLKSRYGAVNPYTVAEARAKRTRLVAENFLESYRTEKKKVRAAIKRAKKLLGQEANSLDFMQFVVYYRTQRTDVMNQAQYLFVPGLKKLAKAKGLSYEQLLYVTKDEILNILPPLKETKSRLKNFAVIQERKIIRCISGAEVDKVRRPLREDVGDVKEVKGTIAYKGKVQGTARLVFGTADFARVKPGDILVTSMTNPHMAPIMKKAAAFVTDEGGITCHAAILSRELKKPCVIGTKIATKVFKDGDKVEVDAEKGIVRKIK